MNVRNEKGYILVAVMAIGLLVAIIGFAASKMSDLGTTTYGSQKKYEIAAAAAEYAVNQAINEVSLKGDCPAVTNSQINDSNQADYEYEGNEAGGYCFIRGQGNFRGANVVKTVVVPNISDFDYGALTLRYGGAAATSGSSAIMNCDDECKSPAIVYGGTLTFTANLDKSSCKKGIYAVGSEGIQSGAGIECTSSPCTGDTLSDRIPKIFNVANWAALQEKLDGTYNGHEVDVSALGLTGSFTSVPTGCECNGTLVLGGVTKCNGANWSIPGGCSSVQGKAVTINSMPAGVNTVYSSSATATDVVTVSGNISDATIVSQHGVVLNSGTISNSMITTTGGSSAGVTLNDANTNNSTIVTAGQFVMNKNSGTLTDTELFAGTMKVVRQGGTFNGGLIYTQGDLVFDGITSGNNNLGTSANPVLILVGGNMNLEKMAGTTEVNGLVFVEGAFVTSGVATGNYTITGAVVANSDDAQSSFNAKGNATLGFNHTILDLLSTRPALGGLVKQTACGGTFGRKAFIANTKVTVY